MTQHPNPSETKSYDEEYERQVFACAANRVRPAFQKSTWDAFWRSAVDAQEIADVAAELKISVGMVYVARTRVMRKLRDEVRLLQSSLGGYGERGYEDFAASGDDAVYFGDSAGGFAGADGTYEMSPDERETLKAEQAVAVAEKQIRRVNKKDRAKATVAFRQVLQHLFDARTKHREAQIADLERRLTQHKQKLKERSEHKDKILRRKFDALKP